MSARRFVTSLLMSHPFLDGVYDIEWSKMVPDRLKDDLTAGIEAGRQEIDRIARIPEDQWSFESVFLAFCHSTDPLDRGWHRAKHLSSVVDTKELRAAVKEMNPIVTEFYAGVYLNTKLWQTVKGCAEKLKNSDLTPVQKRYIENVLMDFRESGADLEEAQKQRLKDIQVELQSLKKQYAENIMDSTEEFKLFVDNEQELDGMTEMAKDAAKQEAVEEGQPEKWLLGLKDQSYSPVMDDCKCERLRKELFLASLEIGSGKFENEGILKKILALRSEEAKLIGFPDYPAFRNSRHMLRSGQQVLSFIERMHDAVEPQFLEDYQIIKDFIVKKTRNENMAKDPWNIRYYAQIRKTEELNFNSNMLRPYFAVEAVLAGLFKVVQILYDIRCEERPTYCLTGADKPVIPEGGVEVWHPDVKFFDVFENSTGRKMGSFYADLYTRKKKDEGAWMDSFHTGNPLEGQPHLGLLVANMPKAVGGKPALLDHYDVETIFHEFGHLSHLLLSEVPIPSLAGTSVATDFVELPSQLLENWTWEKSVLDMFAVHYETGEKLPDDLFDRMIKSRNDRSATRIMRQLRFARLDTLVHLNAEACQDRPILEVEQEYVTGYYIPMSTNANDIKQFPHLFGECGYGAAYYSYLWSEVLDADAFTRFKKEGVLNPATGKAFKECVLSKGNSQPPEELFRAFMGRDPDVTSLLRRSGIKV